MNLTEKILAAEKLIEAVVLNYKRPVVFSSFGKDSMVMLQLLKDLGLKFPIVFHREPYFPAKLKFANQVILDEGYVVYDFPPREVRLAKKNGVMEIVSFYRVGTSLATTYVPTGICEPGDGPFLCGLNDLYSKPCGAFEFHWDVGFVGHKSSDVDPLLGSVPLAVDIKQNQQACDFAYPLRLWTDADIWEYTDRFRVPVNEDRYRDGSEVADRTFNNDYYPACVRCMDPDQPKSVMCPKLGHAISNISNELKWVDVKPDYLQEV